MKKFSEFVKGLCCDHQWGVLSEDNESFFCHTCGATCLREKGRIVEYDATARYGQPENNHGS